MWCRSHESDICSHKLRVIDVFCQHFMIYSRDATCQILGQWKLNSGYLVVTSCWKSAIKHWSEVYHQNVVYLHRKCISTIWEERLQKLIRNFIAPSGKHGNQPSLLSERLWNFNECKQERLEKDNFDLNTNTENLLVNQRVFNFQGIFLF